MANSIPMGDAVKPLFIRQSDTYIFAGTGFFIDHGSRRLLVTADHVPSGEATYVLDVPKSLEFDITTALVATELLQRDEVHDLAVLEPSKRPSHALGITTYRPPGNVKIGTLEYARFRIDEQRRVDQSPSSRIGNIVRDVVDSRFPFPVYELSYPAIRGASGSPVLTLEGQDRFKVVGIVVANAQYELIPVEKFSYKGPGGEEEVTHYYLPAALAIPSVHLTNLLSGIPQAALSE